MLLNAILLQMLLQLQDPSSALLTRLTDQLFTIIILVCVSWVLWKRITKVQDRMDTYLSEDRKEMSMVIRNNTTVMETAIKVLNK